MFRCRPVLFLSVLALALASGLSGCSSTSRVAPSYLTETFPSDTPFQYYSSRNPEGACEISRRALLSQGYQVDESKPLAIRGEKYFRPTADTASRLSISLVCLPSSLGSAVYANALETRFEMKAKGMSAGVSVSALGSLSMPWTGDKDTLVKVGEETVTDPLFYQRMFELIKTLDGEG